MTGWALDLGTTNSRVARWDEATGQPQLVELPDVCRRAEGSDPLEAPRLVPSAVHMLESPGLLDRLGTWRPLARRFFLGHTAFIGRKALEHNRDAAHPAFILSFKPALAAALEAEDDTLVVAAADALGITFEAAAEVPLIAALDRDGPAFWPSIAEALGRVGTAAAVAPLRTIAGRFRFALGLRRVSRQAIAEIQSRLTGATPGQLALADGDAGQLCLAEEDAHGWASMEGEASTDGDEPMVEPPRRREPE